MKGKIIFGLIVIALMIASGILHKKYGYKKDDDKYTRQDYIQDKQKEYKKSLESNNDL